MKIRTFRLFVLLVIPLALLETSCRTRTRRVAPRTEPTQVATLGSPEVTFSPPPAAEFVAAESEPRLDISDLPELNRRAQERGWIRDVFFAFDSFRLDAAARDALRHSAQWLRDNPNISLLIEGHCDERGTAAYNFALGDRRAESARQYLILLGIESDRISTISYGEERPFAYGSNEQAWAQNRRAHLLLQGTGRG